MSSPAPNLLMEALRYDDIVNCMRCGFCLTACPTYKLTGHEPKSPRGRIALARAAAEGQLSLADIAGPLDQCIGCRACETACPAGVQYGQILEAARTTITKQKPQSFSERLIRQVGLRWIMGTPAGIRLGGWALWLWQATGLAWLARKTGLVKALAGPALADLEAAMPPVPSPARRAAGGGPGHRFPAVGEQRARVGYFTGCVQEMVFYQENRDAIALLQAVGCEVLLVPGQGCCGAVHAHAGEEETAHDQARRNIAAFEQSEIDFVVNAAGGCGAALKEYHHWLAGDPGWAERAQRFARSVRDVTEILLELGPLPLGPRPGRVTFQDSCHMRNVQKLVSQPRQLMAAVPELQFVELGNAESCCGAGGIFNVLQPELANQIGQEKAGRVKTAQAMSLVVANPPCELHMRASLKRAGLEEEGVEVVHLVTLLRQSLEAGKKS
ncbi:MAG: (Fe-S)-binding protein [Bacillota bacterium]